MKVNRVLSLFVFVLSFSFLVCVRFSVLEVRAPNGFHVHNLNTGLSYATIQEAINASETLDGHIILVDAGTYNENVHVNKQLSLIGAGAEATVISAANVSKAAWNITSSNVEVSGFNITGATQWYPPGCGIYLYSVSNVTLSHNYITNNTYAIDMLFSNNITIVNNIVYSNYFGINLERGNCNNTIIRNYSSLNTWYGIVVWSWSDNNLVANNIFFDNGEGVTLGYSNFNIVAYNNVSDNGIGIEIQQTSNNNTIYHNSIIDNDVQAGGYHISDSVNFWDDGYPAGGNFWSNYTGMDSYYGVYQNETSWDGIGDTAHVIDANNTDHYPLMAPISIFDAGIWDEAPYSIDIVSNSTITNFQLNATQKIISFNVTGETCSGFCRVTVPNIIVQSMWQGEYTVIVGSQSVEFREWIGVENTYIHFTYCLSTKEVVIVPEFPLTLILPLLMVFACIVVALPKKKLIT